MANIVKYNSFVGRYNISQNTQIKTDLEDFISEFEPIILEALLGAYLYNLLKADLIEGVPQTQKYIDLVNGVTYTDENDIILNYKGIKRMLIQLLFVDWTLQSYYNSNIGNVKPIAEGATVLTEWENKRILAPISQDGVMLYRQTIKFLKDDNNCLTYFSSTEYDLWCPVIIEPLTLISTITLENKYYLNHPHDRD